MGVKGLYKLIEPTALQIQLESLQKKTLAIDASIWLYQSFKAQPDGLDQQHIAVFLSRICKLLYYQIKPVFVFDGQIVPEVKKVTLKKRRNLEREGKEKSDAILGRMLSVRLKQSALEQLSRDQKNPEDVKKLLPVPAEVLKFDIPEFQELSDDDDRDQMIFESLREKIIGAIERHQPDILTNEELKSINIESEGFGQLPVEVQIGLIQEMRQRSKIQVWDNPEQLMAPEETRDFSRNQIQNVVKKSVLGRKLDHLQNRGGIIRGSDGSTVIRRRVAADEDREYILVKNDDNASWTLRQMESTSSADKSLSSPGRTVKTLNESQLKDYLLFDDELTAEDRITRIAQSMGTEDQKIALYQQQMLLIPNGALDEVESMLHDAIFQWNDRTLIDQLEIQQQKKSRGKFHSQDVELVDFTVSFLNAVVNLRQLQVPKEQTVIEREHPTDKQHVENPRKLFEFVDEEFISSDDDELPPAFTKDFFGSTSTSTSAQKSFVLSADKDGTCCNTEVQPAFVEVTAQDELGHLEIPLTMDLPLSLKSGTEGSQKLESSSSFSTLEPYEFSQSQDQASSYSQPGRYFSAPFRKLPESDSQISVQNGNVNFDKPYQISDYSASSILNQNTQFSVEIDRLRRERNQAAQSSSSLSADMIIDVQELLRIFGIPYVVAPSEAEAQCVKLFQAKLVDGIVSDDSDIFPCGGSCVYRNMFTKQKYIECYKQDVIKNELHLDQNRLIMLAYLLGCDYTEGVQGAGPVLAMEIIAEIAPAVPDYQIDILDTLKQFHQRCVAIAEGSFQLQGGASQFAKRLMKTAFKLGFPSDFPDRRVAEAYTNPLVDDSLQKFEWSFPNLQQIRAFLQQKLHWTQTKVDGIVVPVLKQMSATTSTQTTLDGWIVQKAVKSPGSSNIKPTRMQQALEKMTGIPPIQTASQPAKRKRKPSDKNSKAALNTDAEEQASMPQKQRKPRKPSVKKSIKALLEDAAQLNFDQK